MQTSSCFTLRSQRKPSAEDRERDGGRREARRENQRLASYTFRATAASTVQHQLLTTVDWRPAQPKPPPAASVAEREANSSSGDESDEEALPPPRQVRCSVTGQCQLVCCNRADQLLLPYSLSSTADSSKRMPRNATASLLGIRVGASEEVQIQQSTMQAALVYKVLSPLLLSEPSPSGVG